MTWGEAGRLAKSLARDTASAVGASLAEWQYPASREALALMDLYDAFASANFKRPKAYPRPWDPPPKQIGNARLTPGELRAILDEHRGVTSHRRDKNGRLHDVRGRFVKGVEVSGA